MNRRTCKVLQRLSRELVPDGTRLVQRRGLIKLGRKNERRPYFEGFEKLKRAGMPFQVFRNIGARAVYQKLKRAYLAQPANKRRAWLDAQLNAAVPALPRGTHGRSAAEARPAASQAVWLDW